VLAGIIGGQVGIIADPLLRSSLSTSAPSLISRSASLRRFYRELYRSQ